MTMNGTSPTTRQSQNFLQRFWNSLVAPSATITDIGEQRVARLAASFLFTIAFFAFLGGVARLVMANQSLIGAFSGGIGFTLIPTLIAYILARTQWYRVAIFIFSV